MVQAKSENKQIKVGVQGTPSTTNINVTATNPTNPVQAANDKTQMYEQRALAHANNAKLYADQAQESAEQAQESNEAVTQKLEEVKILTNNALITINKDKNEAVAIISTLTEETVNLAIEQANIATENAEITIVQAANALASEKNAKTSETNALTYSNSANASATTAKEQANISTEKAQESADYSELSKQWAISETLVDNTDYSSKHYATVAKEEADKAELYRGQASQHAEEAQYNSNLAAVSAGMASNHLKDAIEQANISIANAEISITQAGNASKSAENSALSEANAKESENKAKTSETNALNSANVATQQAQIAKDEVAKLSTVYKYKGSVATINNLPTNANVGDVYDTQETGMNYAWNGTEWDELGGTFDVSWGSLKGSISDNADLQTALNNKANNNEVVHLSNNETITGVKTFNGKVNFLGSGDSNAVYLSENTRINVHGTTRTVLGFATGTYLIGHSNYNTLIRGSGKRPYWGTGSNISTATTLALTSDIPDVSSFITMADVEAKGYLTEHQDISNLATKTELEAKQDTLTAGKNITIENGVISGTIDLGNYYNKGQVDDLLDDKLENQSNFKNFDGLSIGEDNTDSGKTTIIGFRNTTEAPNTILIGSDNSTFGSNSVCIGEWCDAGDKNSICIGNGACTALENSIQLGEGFNTTPNSFQVGEHQLLNIETGKIPDERLSTNIAKLTDIPDTSNLATKDEIPTYTAGENITIENGVISSSGGSGHELFDIVLKDHILNYEETKGYEPLGGYVYKEAVAGSRYGYPDFYNKVIEEYNEATETKAIKHYLSSNIETISGLTNKEGVISDFSTVSYAQIPALVSGMGYFEFQIKFKLIKNTAINTLISTSVTYDGLMLRINANGVLTAYVSSNGTSWNIMNGTLGSHVYQTDTDYWLKCNYNGNGIFTFSYSTNGKDFITDISGGTDGSLMYSATTLYNLGLDDSKKNPLTGFIDLKECYLEQARAANGIDENWVGANFLEFNYKEHSNGHKFFDIADKPLVDNFYNLTRIAWFYGVDSVNKRIFLPRNDYLTSYVENNKNSVLYDMQTEKAMRMRVPLVDGLGRINMLFNGVSSSDNTEGLTGANVATDFGRVKYTGTSYKTADLISGGTTSTVTPNTLNLDPNGTLYVDISNTQDANKYVYMVVGSTVSNTYWIDAVTQVTAGVKDIEDKRVSSIEAIEQKKINVISEVQATGLSGRATIDLSNVTQSSGLRRLIEVSDSSLMPSWYKVFEETNPQTGEVKKWCEQGGLMQYGATIGAGKSWTATVTLLLPFANTDYRVLLAYGDGTAKGSSAGQEYRYEQKTISSFASVIYNRNASTTMPNTIEFNWEAKGYILEGIGGDVSLPT